MTAPTETPAPARLLSADEARDRVLAAIVRSLPAEEVAITDALGRVTAAPVVSRTALPPWDNSAMDGYAVRAADTTDASESAPIRLRVIGEVRAGTAPTTAVVAGTALRIATGAPLPPGADAVVPVESTTPLDAAGTAGPRGRDATGPLPEAALVHEAVERRVVGPAARQRPRRRRRDPAGRPRADGRRDRAGRRGRRRAVSASIAGRGRGARDR